ncbi:MAG: divergent PAP2 family protein [Anaerolineales bacterium]|nr:divergent PAP2 family protein [Anaerolineales bacterium]
MRDFLAEFLANQALWAGFGAWCIAQLVKPPLHYATHREWNWGLLLSAGGMPSSHSALVVGTTIGIGLQEGFNTPIFAIAWVLSMVVIYDATGVRRQAGDHARILNLMIDELFTGHPLAEKELKERLGHTPREVLGGVVLGIVFALFLSRYV